jgi:hypothetical protein
MRRERLVFKAELLDEAADEGLARPVPHAAELRPNADDAGKRSERSRHPMRSEPSKRPIDQSGDECPGGMRRTPRRSRPDNGEIEVERFAECAFAFRGRRDGILRPWDSGRNHSRGL